jgi:acyl-CoA dehydrogenase
MKNDIYDALDRMLSEHCAPSVVRQIEAAHDHGTLWQVLEDSGFVDALVPAEAGGAGLSLADAAPVATLCGRYAVPVPFAETMLLRGQLAVAGYDYPKGSIGFGGRCIDVQNAVQCPQASLGRVADWVLIEHGGQHRLVATRDAQVASVAFPLDAALTWPVAAVERAPAVDLGVPPLLIHAFVKATQLAGALAAIFERTLDFANDRQQFGKPIGKFQAIQHQLAVMSEHVIAAQMAAQIAAATEGLAFDPLKIGIAKARASEAAVEVAALSHSIHGAIGFTEEFDLQILTRRLHAWRQSAGTESYWYDAIGEIALRSPFSMSVDLLRQATDIDVPHGA